MILKKGSKGQHVKELQEALGIFADGDFGSATDEAVKAYQRTHGLTIDGIVGPQTWERMGLATTDNAELVYRTENGLLIHRHYLPKGEYKRGPTKKEYVFLHHTAGWDNPYKCIDAWGRDDRGSVATEFVLGGQSIKGNSAKYDGEVAQCMPEGSYGWHLGKNGSQHMHTHSVAIEVCNFGWLENGKNYVGTLAHESQIARLEKKFRGHDQWHKYSDKQIEALRLWILYIAERDSIDVRDGLISQIKKVGPFAAFEFNEDAYFGRVKGLWTHTNTRKDKTDMFPQKELVDMLESI